MPDRPPIAVVALGDPKRHDDGLALRVMGRVRTLIAELGVTRAQDHAHRAAGRHSDTRTRADARLRGPASAAVSRLLDGSPRRSADSLALAGPVDGSPLIEWIEGGTEQQKLDSVLGGRKRVVLLDAVRVTGQAGMVHHWYLACPGAGEMSTVRHYNGHFQIGLQHLALWLEDELPEGGTDLIGVEPYDLSPGEGLSRPIRTRLPVISSQVAGILVKILEQSGW